jgi:hypothetical protein
VLHLIKSIAELLSSITNACRRQDAVSIKKDGGRIGLRAPLLPRQNCVCKRAFPGARQPEVPVTLRGLTRIGFCINAGSYPFEVFERGTLPTLFSRAH